MRSKSYDRTEAIYVSRYADGRPAPFHVLDGLPDEVVVARSASGRVSAVKASIVSEFGLDGWFYTREEAGTRAAELTGRSERRLEAPQESSMVRKDRKEAREVSA